MRVTNNMAATQSMNNIWRNSRHVNNIIQSIETGKRIQRPSDNPLLSGRVLRFRTLISETEQFMRNAHTGMSWMEVSEAAFDNILTGRNSLVARINDAVLRAVDGVTNLANVQSITDEIRELFEQLKFVEMNQTYMGRFVFSGFHTDQSPVLSRDMLHDRIHGARTFVMQHQFDVRDIEATQAFHRPTVNSPLDIIDIHIIKLPFTNLDFDEATPADVPDLGIPGFEIVTVPIAYAHAYRPDDTTATGAYPVIHFIPETGELVLSAAAREAWEDGTTITFQRTGFYEGELNPMINFRSWDVTDEDNILSFDASVHDFALEIATNSHVIINSHARNILTPQMYADFQNLIRFINSMQPTDPQAIRSYFQLNHPDKVDNLDHYVSLFISDEAGAFASLIYGRFNNMIELNMRHAAAAQAEHTALGSRMARLEMLQNRLEDDVIAYMGLQSDAEDTDIPAAIMLRNNAEVAMQNALRAIAATSQLSLADFINR